MNLAYITPQLTQSRKCVVSATAADALWGWTKVRGMLINCGYSGGITDYH